MKNKLWLAAPVIKSLLLFGSLFALCSVSTAQMIVKNSAESGLVWITQDGDVGIGTDAPAYKLDVIGGISGAYTPKYVAVGTYGTGAGGASIYNDSDESTGELKIVGNTAQNNGFRNLGLYDNVHIPQHLMIGTRDPVARLTMTGLGQGVYNPITNQLTKHGIRHWFIAEDDASVYGHVSAVYVDPTLSAGSLVISVKGQSTRTAADPGTITSSGSLSYVDKYAQPGVRIMGVQGVINASEANYFIATDPSNSRATAVEATVIENSPQNDHVWAIRTNGAKSYFSHRVGIGREPDATYMLDVNGNIRCNALTQTSDERFKTDVEPLTRALDRVSALQGVAFNWNDPTMGQERQIGFIAQEVEKVLPEVVTTDGEGYKSLAYDRMTSVLVEAIKELKEKEEAQKTRIDELQRQLQVLMERR